MSPAWSTKSTFDLIATSSTRWNEINILSNDSFLANGVLPNLNPRWVSARASNRIHMHSQNRLKIFNDLFESEL
jgi:hypothetical protein